jgi:hypothetical protein
MSEQQTQQEVENLISTVREENTDAEAVTTALRVIAQAYGPETIGLPVVSPIEASTPETPSTYFV